MVKKLFLILLVLAPLSLVAQDKFAYFNAQEVFGQMSELKDVETKMATKRETLQKQAEAIQKEYNDKVAEFQKTPTEQITDAIAQDRYNQLQQLEERYQTFLQTSQAELQKEQEALISPIHQKFMQAVKTVGDENGYNYIFDRAGLLYTGTNAIDISAKVKAKLGIN